MNDAPDENYRPVLLHQEEVARRLRCNIKHVQRLRLQRKLGYIRGRPVTIIEKDVEIYVAWAKVRRIKTGRKGKAFEHVRADAIPKPFSLLTQEEAAVKFDRSLRQIRSVYLRGHVPYIRGRTPLIDESDLIEYFEAERRAAQVNIPGTPEYEAKQAKIAEDKMFHRLKIRLVRQRVARFLKMTETAPQK
jgi:hypothetical protein